MMEILASLLTGAASGGATGLLGVIIQRWADHRQRAQDIEITKLQLQAARETRQMELEAQERMAANAAAVAQLQAQLDAQAREVEADTAAYTASVGSDRATYLVGAAQEQSRAARWLMAVVDAVRGLMRPSITAYSLILLTLLALWVRDMHIRSGVALTLEQQHDLMGQVVGTIIYLAVTVVVWWFGVRPGQPPKR
jgi:hypothetical protein